MLRLHCLFAHDAVLDVHKSVSEELVDERCSIVISLLSEFALKLGDEAWGDGSNWSMETNCPGHEAILEAFLSSPFTLQGSFVILPYWHAVQKGFLQVRRRLGSCPERVSCRMCSNDK